jgi:hypothetical protein
VTGKVNANFLRLNCCELAQDVDQGIGTANAWLISKG